MAARAQPRKRRVDHRTRGARAEGRDARAALIDAAAAVFSRRGFREASVDEVAQEAGLSKGAVYWHFEGKDELFLALHEERVERRQREMIELLESAPPDQDVSPEMSRRFLELLQREGETLVLDQEFWSLALRDPKLRKRYARRQAQLRSALAKALEARSEHLGDPEFGTPAEEVATAFIALGDGLALAKLIDPDAVPDHLFGETAALVHDGLVARAERAARPEG
jgi:AcrR family transcriptional regulator